jgi:Rod binding domain-containing protein
MDYLSPIRAQQNVPGRLSTNPVDPLAEKIKQKDQSTEELKKLSQQFESVLLNQLFSVMRKTVPQNGLFDSSAGDMYKSMMDEEMASQMSKNRSVGLSDMLYKELVRLDEKTHNDPDAAKKIAASAPLEKIKPQPIELHRKVGL